MKVRLFTPLWGDDHIERFRRGTMASLLWHRNRVALANHVVGWDVYSKIENYEVVGHLCQHLMPASLFPIGNSDNSKTLRAAVIKTISQCLLEGSALVTIMPDVIYGDGTFETLFALGARPGVCLLVPHMRALPTIYDSIRHPTSNAKLVSLAVEHAHSTWTNAELSLPKNNIHMGGVSWEKTGDKLWVVQHRLANPWLSNIIASDLDWWNQQEAFGTFDHNWPGKMVVEGRARWIGSSDAAFMVEVTRENEGQAPIGERNDLAPDTFYRSGPHHDLSRFFFSVFRGE